MYLLDVHNAHEMGENLEKHGSSPQLPFKVSTDARPLISINNLVEVRLLIEINALDPLVFDVFTIYLQ